MLGFIEKTVREAELLAQEQEMVEKRLPSLSHWLHTELTKEQFSAVKSEHLDMLGTVMAKGVLGKEGIALDRMVVHAGGLAWEAKESQSLKDHVGVHVIYERGLGFARSIIYKGTGGQRGYKLGVLFGKSLEEMRRVSEDSQALAAGHPERADIRFSEKDHSLTATRERPVDVITNEVYHLLRAPYAGAGHAPMHVWVYATSLR